MPEQKPLFLSSDGLPTEFGTSDTVPQSAVPSGIPLAKIAQSGASTGQVVKWNGSAWAPANDNTGGGGGSFPGVETPENVRTSDFTAVVGTIHMVNVGSGSVTVTPPSSPTEGDAFGVCDAALSATASKNVIVAFGSQKFCAQTSVDYRVITPGGTAVFVFAGTTTGWICVTRG